MKLAVFSDVHGNLEALDLFIAHANKRGAHGYACLGDIIGYGPNPNECVEKIRSLDNLHVVMGNHEWAALHLEESSGFMNVMAHEAIVWTSKNLTPINTEYIAELPDKIQSGQFTLVHASAFRPFNWEYLISGRTSAIKLCLLNSSTRFTFVGHTHRPMIADQSGESLSEITVFDDKVNLIDASYGKLLINPGSIGQPRGSIRKPCYVMIETEKNTVTWHWLNDYKPAATAKKILATDLPPECAYYLSR